MPCLKDFYRRICIHPKSKEIYSMLWVGNDYDDIYFQEEQGIEVFTEFKGEAFLYSYEEKVYGPKFLIQRHEKEIGRKRKGLLPFDEFLEVEALEDIAPLVKQYRARRKQIFEAAEKLKLLCNLIICKGFMIEEDHKAKFPDEYLKIEAAYSLADDLYLWDTKRDLSEYFVEAYGQTCYHAYPHIFWEGIEYSKLFEDSVFDDLEIVPERDEMARFMIRDMDWYEEEDLLEDLGLLPLAS